MIDEDSVSKSELLSRGWKDSQIRRILDTPESRLPATHFMSTTGEPVFSSSRVNYAERALALRNQPLPTNTEQYDPTRSSFPATKPVFGFSVPRWFPVSSYRISHPHYGRAPGSRQREAMVYLPRFRELFELAGLSYDENLQLTENLTACQASAPPGLAASFHGLLARESTASLWAQQTINVKNANSLLLAISMLLNGGIRPLGLSIPDSIVTLMECAAIRLDPAS